MTWSPWLSSSRTTADPMKPAAPVTIIFIRKRCLRQGGKVSAKRKVVFVRRVTKVNFGGRLGSPSTFSWASR